MPRKAKAWSCRYKRRDGWFEPRRLGLVEPRRPDRNAGARQPRRWQRGRRLPFSSRISANLSLDYEFPVGRFTGTVGADLSYVGERFGVFIAKDADGNPISARQPFPGYAKTDLRTGLKMSDWTVDLYINNVTDKRGILGGGLGTPDPDAFTIVHPRTVGLTLARNF